MCTYKCKSNVCYSQASERHLQLYITTATSVNKPIYAYEYIYKYVRTYKHTYMFNMYACKIIRKVRV